MKPPRVVPTLLLFLASGALVSFFAWPVRSQGNLQVGYAVVTASQGSRIPTATALFSYRNAQGILASEAGVAAVTPIRRGRIFVDGSIPTGLALVNPADTSISVSLALRTESGALVGQNQIMLGPREHLPRFVGQLGFPDIAPDFQGSLSFETTSVGGVAALTIRQALNGHDEPLLSTLPVADLDSVGSSGTPDVVFPHLGAGGPLTSQVLLINPSSQALTGEIRFFNSSGLPLELELDGASGSSFPYQISANGVFLGLLTSTSGIVSGYAVVTTNSGPVAPVGTAIFQFRDGLGKLMSEAGVGASLRTTRARIFVDEVGTSTGVALANPGNSPAAVELELLDINGLPIAQVMRNLPAGGYEPVFVGALFPAQTYPGFTGLLEIRASQPVAPVTLKLTQNARNELVLTTLPVADLTRLSSQQVVIFPQIGFGLGFETRFIFISTEPTLSQQGLVVMRQSNGTALLEPVGGEVTDRFPFALALGSARQVRPGNTAQIATILLDPVRPGSAEIPVGLGKTRVIRPAVIDSDGSYRDDFPVTFSSLSTEVATLDSRGQLTGKKPGFSTLSVQAGGVLATFTATVTDLKAGTPGFSAVGVAQDAARRVFLAQKDKHTILVVDEPGASPKLWAGQTNLPGSRDDSRTVARFRAPAFLALNQSDSSLYVSDQDNHTIRRILPGGVETVAGAAQVSGSADGAFQTARFNRPQGIALDEMGRLWVADTGNHTIRRIDLAKRIVSTIAGSPGQASYADGFGNAARFSSPSGIAIEIEPLQERLEREARGEPPPLLSILVADSGNNRIRRVREDGMVTTIDLNNDGMIDPSSSSSDPELQQVIALDLSSTEDGGPRLLPAPCCSADELQAPAAIAVDSIGNIFISQPSEGRIRIALRTGQVVDATEPGTVSGPAGLFIGRNGQILAGDGSRGFSEIVFGAPQITALLPARVGAGGGQIRITGTNFAPDTIVVAGGVVVRNYQVENSTSILLTVPMLDGGRTTLTVQNRGGIAQAPLLVDPEPPAQLLPGEITTVAGGSTFGGDGAAATSAVVAYPDDVAIDSDGNIYVAEGLRNRVRRIDRISGLITTVAGGGSITMGIGDGGPGVAATLENPVGVALDRSGVLYIAEAGGNRIRKWDPATGLIETIAGYGAPGFSGDGGPASEAELDSPFGIRVDSQGNIFFSDRGNHRIRMINAADSRISTVAGNGLQGFEGDGGPATSASLSSPGAIAIGENGDIYVCDAAEPFDLFSTVTESNNRIRRINRQTGMISTIAGSGDFGYSGDGGPATQATMESPHGIAVDPSGGILVADTYNNRIRRISLDSGVIETIAGNGDQASGGDGGPALEAALGQPRGLSVDGAGNIVIADTVNHRIRRISAADQTISTLAGSGAAGFLGDGGEAVFGDLLFPTAVTQDSQGNLFIADQLNNLVRRVGASSGVISRFAGRVDIDFRKSLQELLGDGGSATNAAVFFPNSIAFGPDGNLYISSLVWVRKVDTQTGVISTVVGTECSLQATDCPLGDGGPANEATLGVSLIFPNTIVFDTQGDLLIADASRHRIRRVRHQDGIIETIAGTGEAGFDGDGGPAISAALNFPTGLAVDSDGNIFIADTGNALVRMVSSFDGSISTVVGSGVDASDFSSEELLEFFDGVPAIAAPMFLPLGLALDSQENLYIADTIAVRRWDRATGLVQVVAGELCEENCRLGDGGAAVKANLLLPIGLHLGGSDNLWIADSLNNRIRFVRQAPAAAAKVLFYDDVEGFDQAWTPNQGASWAPTSFFSQSGFFSWLAVGTEGSSDQQLTLSQDLQLPNSSELALSFWHAFDLESAADGGVVELSRNQGQTWEDLGSRMIVNGYNSSVTSPGPLQGRSAFSGLADDRFYRTIIDLSGYKGQKIRIRFRLVSDFSVSSAGWVVDDILVTSR